MGTGRRKRSWLLRMGYGRLSVLIDRFVLCKPLLDCIFLLLMMHLILIIFMSNHA